MARLRRYPDLGGGSMSGTRVVNTKSPIYNATLAPAASTSADFPLATGEIAYVEAFAILRLDSAGSVTGGGLVAAGWFKNSGGTVSALTALTGSTNPMSSTNHATLRPEGLDSQFVGGGPSTLALSGSGANVRATLTYNSLTGTTVEVNIYFRNVLAQGANGA